MTGYPVTGLWLLVSRLGSTMESGIGFGNDEITRGVSERKLPKSIVHFRHFKL